MQTVLTLCTLGSPFSAHPCYQFSLSAIFPVSHTAVCPWGYTEHSMHTQDTLLLWAHIVQKQSVQFSAGCITMCSTVCNVVCSTEYSAVCCTEWSTVWSNLVLKGAIVPHTVTPHPTHHTPPNFCRLIHIYFFSFGKQQQILWWKLLFPGITPHITHI